MGEGPEAVLLGKPIWAKGDRHTVTGAAAGIDYSRVKGRPGALRTTVTQNLICAHPLKDPFCSCFFAQDPVNWHA